MNDASEKPPVMMVFDIDNVHYDLVGVLEVYESVQITTQNTAYGEMTITAPLTDYNLDLLQEGRVLYIDSRQAAIITQTKRQALEGGSLALEVKGRTLLYLLSWRCVKDATVIEDKTVFEAACKLFWDNFPTTGDRRVPWLQRSVHSNVSTEYDEAHVLKVSDTIDVTDVYMAISSLATTYNVSAEIRMYPADSAFCFYFGSGVDRTLSNKRGTSPVVLSADMQDLLSSSYEHVAADFVNYAYVKGEENDDGNITTEYYDGLTAGWERRELYVDASGVSSTTDGDDGDEYTVTEEEYIVMLKNEAKAQFAERNSQETYEAVLNQVGEHRYKVDEDFFLGDKVTIIDTNLQVQLDAWLTSVEYVYGKNKSEVVLHFGYDNMKDLLNVIQRRW